MNLITRLDELKGKTFLINAKRQKILNYKLDNGTVTIATDKDIFEFDRTEIDDKLKTFLPASETNENLTVLCRTKEQLPNLANLIFENIANIQSDEKFIPKAVAIDKSINTLISLMKTEIVYMKMMAKE